MEHNTEIPVNETIAQKALRILSPVPAENWIVDDFTNEEGDCCAIGHFQRLTSDNPNDFSENNCTDKGYSDIRNASGNFIRKRYNTPDDISSVNNDNVINGYTEPVIKDRVIHLLSDMVAAGY